MKKCMRFVPILLLATALFTISACNQTSNGGDTVVKTPTKTPREMITKSWKLHKMSISDPNGMMSPAIMGSASFTFYNDGKYEIVLGEPDKGVWQFGPGNKILVTTSSINGNVGEIDIEYLTDTLLILTNNEGESPVRMELKPE